MRRKERRETRRGKGEKREEPGKLYCVTGIREKWKEEEEEKGREARRREESEVTPQ